MKRRKLQVKDLPYFNGRKYEQVLTPQLEDEEYISGLESDDDVLKNIHEMGIGLSEDYEHPKELNIAKDIDAAEEYKRTH